MKESKSQEIKDFKEGHLPETLMTKWSMVQYFQVQEWSEKIKMVNIFF